MEVLKFNLSGKMAHFKKPDVNSYAYYTFGHIPKVTLLGLIGAIIGLNGYSKQTMDGTDLPEFYQRLKDIKVGIVPPYKSKGYFSRKIQVYNNSVGYANKDGNLIVREQWLEDVSWDIYLDMNDIENDVRMKIVEYILNGKAVYTPYLGKNDHFAIINDAKLVDMEKQDGIEYIDSLFSVKKYELDDETKDDKLPFLYKDYITTKMHKCGELYLFEELGFTNRIVLNSSDAVLFRDGEKIVEFI